MKLKQLSKKLPREYCEYYDFRENIPNFSSEEIPKEAIEISHEGETLIIAHFGEELPLRITYQGNVRRMRETIDSLRISTALPSNLGEKVFHRFRQSLEDLDYGDVTIEQRVRPGKEHQFEGTLKKVINYYSQR